MPSAGCRRAPRRRNAAQSSTDVEALERPLTRRRDDSRRGQVTTVQSLSSLAGLTRSRRPTPPSLSPFLEGTSHSGEQRAVAEGSGKNGCTHPHRASDTETICSSPYTRAESADKLELLRRAPLAPTHRQPRRCDVEGDRCGSRAQGGFQRAPRASFFSKPRCFEGVEIYEAKLRQNRSNFVVDSL